jgi:hypothetical protein
MLRLEYFTVDTDVFIIFSTSSMISLNDNVFIKSLVMNKYMYAAFDMDHLDFDCVQ